MLNAVEGDRWLHGNKGNEHIRGDSALDEIAWFVFTTIHCIPFGEFRAAGVAGRLITMFCASLGYLFAIYLMCIIMLSQLPGEKAPTLCSSVYRMMSALWPSYCVFLSVVLAIGSMVGHYLSRDHEGLNEWPSGMYWAWETAHRIPFGDIYPDTAVGRTVTIPLAFMGVLYWPYALGCVAVRCPSLAQHRDMMAKLQSEPEDAMGRGYFQPPDGNDHVANFATLGEAKVDEDEKEHRCRSGIAVCIMLTLTFIGMIFVGGPNAPSESVEMIMKALELDLPPGIRSKKDEMPSIVWMFWLHEFPQDIAQAKISSITTAVDIPVQVVDPTMLKDYNVSHSPYHRLMDRLAPNHKRDYLFAYFMHHYGGAFMQLEQPYESMRLPGNATWEEPIDFMATNESYYIMGSPVSDTIDRHDPPCDESNIRDAWCKEMQFASSVTFAETQEGLSGFKHSTGPCCSEVLKTYATGAGRFLRTDQVIMRKQSHFTHEWIKLVHEHLDAKNDALLKNPPPMEPCCHEQQGEYPIRWDELVGEIWSVLIPKYAEHVNVDGKALLALEPGVPPAQVS
jgi:hypothetical protein